MPVTLNLSPEAEERLKARAARIGQTLESYLRVIVERDLMDPEATPESDQMRFATPEERAKAFIAWTDSFPPVKHFVDHSRESIYFGPDE
jgi:plasmid stability protein